MANLFTGVFLSEQVDHQKCPRKAGSDHDNPYNYYVAGAGIALLLVCQIRPRCKQFKVSRG